jgi:methyl-accepting chemotaxis protein
VVADEVRKLSEEVVKSTNQISKIVSSIQETISKSFKISGIYDRRKSRKVEVTNGIRGIRIANDAKHSFEVIQLDMNNASQQVIEVSAAVQQLSASSEEIRKITEFTKRVQKGGVEKIQNMNEPFDELITSANTILFSTDRLYQKLNNANQ